MSEGEAGQARRHAGLEALVSQIGAALKDSGSPCGGIDSCRVATPRAAGDLRQPETRTQARRRVHIAYQVHGEGPIDLVIASAG